MVGFDITTLVALYDQGSLVPFIGSGISAGPCVDWSTMVDRLRDAAKIPPESAAAGATGDPARRAAAAILALGCTGTSLAEVLRTGLYQQEAGYGRNALLSKLYWPLICTTNYDDTYVGARIERARRKANKYPDSPKGLVSLPRVYGRSETDCRRVLQHMASPVGEVYWAVQGMLQPRPELLAALRALSDNDDDTMRRAFRVPELEAELVVGPAQYRAIANRAQHFRRAFAEMFYHRSLLFLGTGLSEAYFLSLFDEALEMLGPPSRPHFALVDENKVDPDFLRAHYNIICRTYKGRDEFWRLEELLKELVAEVRRPRPQLQSWGCRMDRGTRAASGEPQFSVEGTKLPERPSSLTEVLVISVGRDDTSAKNKRGVPLLGEIATKRVKDAAPFRWINDWIGNWPGIDHLYAVAARDIWSQFDAGSRDLRSPEAVRQGFRAFLDFASANGVTLVRSMLLAAGRTRTFEPWVSLAQMARAYGEWYSCWSQAGTGEPIKVVIHVVTDDVLVQLRNGQFGLAERLRGSSEIRFRVEIIDRSGNVHVEQHVASEDQALEELPVLKLVQSMEPALGVYPYGRPSSVLRKLQFTEILKISLKNFGIVTGSTLIVNYRRHWRQGADDH